MQVQRKLCFTRVAYEFFRFMKRETPKVKAVEVRYKFDILYLCNVAKRAQDMKAVCGGV